MAPIKIRAVKDMPREHPQLAGGAGALAVQGRFEQAGFMGSDLGDRLSARFDFIGDRVQERGPRGAGGAAVGPEGVLSRTAGLIDQFAIAMAEAVRRSMGGGGRELRA
jgi:hypothetical protein